MAIGNCNNLSYESIKREAKLADAADKEVKAAIENGDGLLVGLIGVSILEGGVALKHNKKEVKHGSRRYSDE